MEENFNPFDEEFNKDDVVGITTDDEKEPLLTLEDLDLYDEQKFLNQKFKNIVEDPNIKKISTLPDELKELAEENEFVNYEDIEKLTDDAILQKKFRDFLILRKISGNLKGISGNTRIPAYKITETKNLIIEDDPIVTDFDEETKTKTTIITHKNELDEIEYIEVLCECGNKTIIKFNYDTKIKTFSPASFRHEDYDPDETIYAFDIAIDENNEDTTEESNNEPSQENDLRDEHTPSEIKDEVTETDVKINETDKKLVEGKDNFVEKNAENEDVNQPENS